MTANDLTRMADALERIAAALEHMTAPPKLSLCKHGSVKGYCIPCYADPPEAR
jgi:hypothetical protein